MTRKKHPLIKKHLKIKQYSDQEQRPGRVLLETIKSVFPESETVLNSHTYYYGDVIKHFKALKAGFADVEKLLLDAELARPAYVRNAKLNEDYKHVRSQERVKAQALEDIESGKALREWEDRLSQLSVEINVAHRAQLDMEKKRDAAEIYKKLNQTRALNKDLLEQAKAKLDQLQELADQINCCTGSSKQKDINDQVKRQEEVVRELEKSANEPIQHVIDEIVAEPHEISEASKKVADLQARYNTAKSTVEYYRNHKDDLIAEKKRGLAEISVEVSKAIKAINQDSLHYHANLDTQVMHGIIRLYALFNTYKTEFDHAVIRYLKNKDNPVEFSARLNECKTAVDGLINQLWCDNYRHLSAKEIHDQYLTLPQKFKDQLLEKKPDTTALAQVFSAAEAAKVSAVGMFKKPVAKETEEKRKHLVKTQGQVNGRVVYKI